MSTEERLRFEEEQRRKQERQQEEQARRAREEELRRIRESQKNERGLNEGVNKGRPTDERPGRDD